MWDAPGNKNFKRPFRRQQKYTWTCGQSITTDLGAKGAEDRGTFGPRIAGKWPMLKCFRVLRECRPRGVPAQGAEPDGRDIGWGSGHLNRLNGRVGARGGALMGKPRCTGDGNRTLVLSLRKLFCYLKTTNGMEPQRLELLT